MTLVVAAALVATAAGLVAQGRASFPGRNGDIVFTGSEHDSELSRHVYSMAADGAHLTRVTTGAAEDQVVRAAPGGSRLVVSRDTREQCGHVYWAQGVDLFTLDADGANVKRVTDNCPISDSTPAWSPSGTHLVFSRFGELWSMRPDGSDLAKLTCNAARTGGDSGDYAPAWSPDGRQIAFARLGDVYLMDANGGDAHPVAAGSSPSFSPDGRQLAYAGAPFSREQGIHVSSLDGGHDRRVSSGYDGGPVWAPDGTAIAFVHVASIVVPQRFVIQTVNADGTGLRTVMDAVNAFSLDWANLADGGAAEPSVTAADTACAEKAPETPPSGGGTPAAPAAAPTSILASAVQPPNRLLVAGVRFSPAVLRSRRPFTLDVVVHDAQGRSVVNAVVQATALRGDARPTVPRLTDADGAARLRVTPTRRLRLAGGSRLILVIRVRRPTDGWAAAASGSRLVSVRTDRASKP